MKYGNLLVNMELSVTLRRATKLSSSVNYLYPISDDMMY